MTVAVVIAAVIVVFGLYWAAVPRRTRPANAPETWTPNTRRAAGAGIALGGAILLVVFLLL